MSIHARGLRVGLAVVTVFAAHLLGEAGSTAGARGTQPTATSAGPAPVVTTAPAPPSVLSAEFAYAGTDDPDQQLSATWNPTRTDAPWVVTIHGGSWVRGGPAGVRDAATLFARNGFQVFNLRYRLVGSTTPAGAPVRWTDQRRDVLTAISWIRANAAAFGIDADRGALYGSSAGGNLALGAGLSGDGTNGIRAVVSVSGVVRPSRLWDAVLGHLPGERATAAMRRLALDARNAVGCPYPPGAIPGCAAQWRAVDLAGAISPHDPAVLMYQGLADRKVPWRMASQFRGYLNRAGVGGALVLVPLLGHDPQVALDDGPRQAELVAFLRQQTAAGR